MDARREKIRQKMSCAMTKKEVVRQRANLWSKGRKRGRELIKAWKSNLKQEMNWLWQ